MKTVSYIVRYIDPDRPSEGVEKTRLFESFEKAQEYVEHLDRSSPNARDVKIIKQESTVIRTRVQ